MAHMKTARPSLRLSFLFLFNSELCAGNMENTRTFSGYCLQFWSPTTKRLARLCTKLHGQLFFRALILVLAALQQREAHGGAEIGMALLLTLLTFWDYTETSHWEHEFYMTIFLALLAILSHLTYSLEWLRGEVHGWPCWPCNFCFPPRRLCTWSWKSHCHFHGWLHFSVQQEPLHYCAWDCMASFGCFFHSFFYSTSANRC